MLDYKNREIIDKNYMNVVIKPTIYKYKGRKIF